MKKLVIAVALLFAAAFCAGAQNLSVLSKAARAAYDFLSKEGYKPYIDEADDVVFKAQGYSFYVDNTKSDDTYLQIVLPYLMEVDTEDLVQFWSAMGACNEVTHNIKLVQAYVDDDGDVMFATDTYLGNDGKMDEFIDASITYMIRAIDSFNEYYKDFMED